MGCYKWYKTCPDCGRPGIHAGFLCSDCGGDPWALKDALKAKISSLEKDIELEILHHNEALSALKDKLEEKKERLKKLEDKKRKPSS